MLKPNMRRMVAVALVITTTFITMPVSAADFPAAKPVIGSVSAVGPVELRGVNISQEGTLFGGDNIRAGQKAYAKVLLGTGSKIELAEKTDVTVNRDAEGVLVAMKTGTVGFTARTPVRIDVLPFEITASDNSAGHVAIMTSTTAGVRAVNGKLTVRNVNNSQSFILKPGEERLLGLTNGLNAPALANIASNAPVPIPAPVPQAPAGRTTGGLAMDTGAWLAVIGGAAVAGIAVWGLIVAMNNRDDVKDLRSSVDRLNTTITTQNTAQQQALKNLANAQAIALTTAQLQSQQVLAQALASQAQTALAVAGNPTASAQAASLAAQSASVQTQLSALMTDIQAAQAALAAGTGTQAQVNALLQREEALRVTSNTIAAQLNALLLQFRTVPGVPQTSVTPVTGPILGTISVPL